MENNIDDLIRKYYKENMGLKITNPLSYHSIKLLDIEPKEVEIEEIYLITTQEDWSLIENNTAIDE